MRVFGLLPCLVFLVAGGLGIMLFWTLLAALNRGQSRAMRPPGRGREPGRCQHRDCNHLNNPQACYCGNCGRSLDGTPPPDGHGSGFAG